MGDPGTYKQELPDMPDSLNSFRNFVHSVLRGEMTQNEASYPGPSGSNMAMDPPDYLPTLRGYAANWVNIPAKDDIWDVVETTLEAMMGTGEPVSSESWYTAAKAKVVQDLEATQADINEAAIVGGARYGTGIIRAHAKEITRRYAEIGVRYAELEWQALTDAKNRKMVAAGHGVELGRARSTLRAQWLTGVLGAAVSDWMAKIQAEQLRYQDFMNRQFTHRPSFNAATQYALGYPFQGSNPVITPNPWVSAGQGMLQAGAMIGSAALIAASSQEAKKNIRAVNEEAIHDAMLNTHVHAWEYKGQDITHIGPIAERAPHFMRNAAATGIYVSDYIAALHVTIQQMDRRIKELENAIR